ncbi:lytic transglycosylase domain-containing protein [Lachnobacterium bovis]|uniref:lytic transglycosylase domain-containing protein n=1 Tax=Lachnobacterium bovis TaxID=140626 RepID=UPI000684E424|nr:lytic transglycosylase domain-containing protein [Lachnobacterium bovis]
MSISIVPYLDYDLVKQQLKAARTAEYNKTLADFNYILTTASNAVNNYKKNLETTTKADNNSALNTSTTTVTYSSGNSKVGSFKYPSEYEKYFEEASRTYNVDINLLKCVAKAESDFNPKCVSGAGAVGIMQLMPATAKSLGVSNSYDPRENIMGGAKYIADKLALYNGNVSLALAAYNAGSGNVKKYGGIPPFKETQNYVKKILNYLGDDMKTTTTISDDKQPKTSANIGTAYKKSEEEINAELNNVLNSTLAKMNVTKASLDEMMEALKAYKKDYEA